MYILNLEWQLLGTIFNLACLKLTNMGKLVMLKTHTCVWFNITLECDVMSCENLRCDTFFCYPTLTIWGGT